MLTKKQRAKIVGERIKEARRLADYMSQVELSKRLAKRFGTEPEAERRALGNNERGSYEPRLYRLEAIAEATGQPLEFFAVGEGNGDGVDQPFQEAV